MPSSVQPLVLTYSATASRSQATDLIDLDGLNTALDQITDKLNEIITALNVTTRDDDTLLDNIIDRVNFDDNVYNEFSSMAQAAVEAAEDDDE